MYDPNDKYTINFLELNENGSGHEGLAVLLPGFAISW